MAMFVGLGAVFGAQSALCQDNFVKASVCEVVRNPGAFDNKFVRFTATLVIGFEVSAISDPADKDCGAIWFTYPGGAPTTYLSLSTGTPLSPRPSVHLKNDRRLRQFQRYAEAEMYSRQQHSSCIGCHRYEVTAVMIGLIEWAGAGQGFGHMNASAVQFVLRSVQSVSARDLASTYDSADYSKEPVRFPTGYLQGAVVSPDGRPISGQDVQVLSTSDPETHLDNDLVTTDEKGRFEFAVPPGKYVIGFNTFWPPSAKAPYPPTYYPSTQQRDAATVVSVSDKRRVKNLVLTLPQQLTARVVRVRVRAVDGAPVAQANVWLSQVSSPYSVVGTSVSHTSPDGRFDLIALEGIDYILHADKYSGLGRVACAKRVLLLANESVPALIELSLTITDFRICTDSFDIPTETVTQQ